jgi:hypothetical protein
MNNFDVKLQTGQRWKYTGQTHIHVAEIVSFINIYSVELRILSANNGMFGWTEGQIVRHILTDKCYSYLEGQDAPT